MTLLAKGSLSEPADGMKYRNSAISIFRWRLRSTTLGTSIHLKRAIHSINQDSWDRLNLSPYPPILSTILIPVGPIPMSSTDVHQISFVQLVVGLVAAWFTTFLISKSISLRSALKYMGWSYLLFEAIERGWWRVFTKELPGERDPDFTPLRECGSCRWTHLPVQGNDRRLLWEIFACV